MSDEQNRRQADLARRVKTLEQRRTATKQAQVTAIDTGANTFTADLPPDSEGVVQTLTPVAAPPQFLPSVGQWVKLRLEGAKPIYEPAGIAENAVTGREIAPGAVDEIALDLPTATKLNTALDTANGSNRTIYSADPAPGSPQGGERTGDSWYQFDGSTLVKAWRWNGSAYVEHKLGDGMFDTLSAAKISTGTLSAGVSITVGDPLGHRVVIDHDGGISKYVEGYDEPSVRIPGGEGGNSYFAVTDPATGESLANIDAEGKISGQAGSFSSLTVGGQEVVVSDTDQDGPRGCVEYGGTYGVTTATTTERGAYEVAADLQVGRLYEIRTSHLLLQSSVAGTVMRARIRMTDDGSTPTTSSFSMATGSKTAGTGDEGMTLTRRHAPAVDGTHRFLLTYGRWSGTGNVTIFGRDGNTGLDAFPVQLFIDDVGPFRGNMAATNDGGGTPTTAAATYTKRYNPIWSGTYAGGTLDASKGNAMYQGMYGGVSYRSMVGFDHTTIMADLSGATIESCYVVLYAQHWYYNSGGTAVIGTHGNTTKPGTWTSVDPDRWRSGAWPKPGQRRINLGPIIGGQFQSGFVKGVTLGPIATTDLTYYGRFAGAGQSYQPYIEIRYSK